MNNMKKVKIVKNGISHYGVFLIQEYSDGIEQQETMLQCHWYDTWNGAVKKAKSHQENDNAVLNAWMNKTY